MFDQAAQQAEGRFDTREFQVFVGLVRTGDVAGAEHQRLAAELLKIRRFGGERYHDSAFGIE